MTQYAKVHEGSVIEVLPGKPAWYFDDGSEVTDQWLIENQNIYPVIYSPPDNVTIRIKPMSDWVIESDHVEKTYWVVLNDYPVYNPILKKLELKDESEWIWTDNNVSRTYNTIDMTEEESIEFCERVGYKQINVDNEQYFLKPYTEWIFEGDVPLNGRVEKTYWEIIDDPNRENYPDTLYIHELQDSTAWIRTDITIQKTYNYVPRDLTEAKLLCKDSLAFLRWSIETGGIYWDTDNKRIHTSRESQSSIFSAYISAKDGIFTSDRQWKTMDGFVILTPAQIESMGSAVQSFIQEVYDKEVDIISQIDDQTTFANLETLFGNFKTLGWPAESIYLAE